MKYVICKNPKTCEFGIEAVENGKTVHMIPDITSDYSTIEKLSGILNGCEVELCHFDYIIEDYLTDFIL